MSTTMDEEGEKGMNISWAPVHTKQILCELLYTSVYLILSHSWEMGILSPLYGQMRWADEEIEV